jgi:anti-sigma regulatory factor (Ser/Thr protein kinase)
VRTRRFSCRRESVSAARQFARAALAKQSSETLDAIELMVSELATNCMQHAHSEFEIAIDVSRPQIRIEARDAGEGRPAPRSPAPTEPTGRGLRIVEAMSDAWGVVRSPSGKTVWFTIAQRPAEAEEQAEMTAPMRASP